MSKLLSILLALVFCAIAHAQSVSYEKQFMIVVHRHGDRSPIFQPPEYQPLWPQGPGQLTGTGVHQLWEVGANLSRIFPLSENYTYGLIHVQASDTDRTLQSAQSMMVALFPPGSGPRWENYHDEDPYFQSSLPYGFQPVPIHTILPDTDYVLRGWDNCKKYHEYLENEVYTSDEFLAKQAENQPLFDTLNTALRSNITLSTLNPVYDLLFCDSVHNIKDPNNISDATIAQVIELNKWVFQREFAPTKYSPLIGGALLSQILDDFQNFLTEASPNVARFYSAHDVTVAALLSTMQEQLDDNPPYASHVVIVLSEKESKHYVEVYYNSEELFPLKLCKEAAVNNRCPLEKFIELYTPYALPNEEEECNRPYVAGADNSIGATTPSSTTFILVLVAIVGVLILAAFGGLMVYFYRKRSQVGVINDPQTDLEEPQQSEEDKQV